jgi:hypothetical protein
MTDIEQAIIDAPSAGPAGLAIKAYLRYHYEHGSNEVAEPCPLLDEGYLNPETDRSIIKDAVRFLPESAPLAAAVLEPKAEAVPEKLQELAERAAELLPLYRATRAR